MTSKKPKIVAAGSGLDRQSVPGESLLFKITGDEKILIRKLQESGGDEDIRQELKKQPF